MLRRVPLAVSMIALFMGAPLAAQAIVNSISADFSLLGTKLRGPDMGGPGYGFDAQIAYRTPGASIAGGYQYIDNQDDVWTDERIFRGLYIEPRYTFTMHTPLLHPYVAARVSGLQQLLKSDLPYSGFEFENTGVAYGVGGGIDLDFFALALELSATYSRLAFGKFGLDTGLSSPRPTASGSSMTAIRFALVFFLHHKMPSEYKTHPRK